MAISANRLELLQIADAVAREKSIDRMVVIEAMQDAIEKAAKLPLRRRDRSPRRDQSARPASCGCGGCSKSSRPSKSRPARSTCRTPRRRTMPPSSATIVTEPLPPIEFGRIAAQSAKQVIVQKVRDAERERMYDEYINRIGEIVNGTVKRVEYGNVIVDLGRGEAIIRRDELIPREMYRYGDRVRAYIYDVRREQRGPQIFLSRTHPQFMAKLFMQEVPEIYDGIITIRSIARDPGSRAKIAVTSSDSSIDPVGACVGMRGSRVQAVVGELQGEKIDIIPWTENIADLVVSALQPADVAKVVLDEQAERIEVVVPDEQLSLAIGRRGQNVRLASQLIGWDIDILTEQEESERRQKEFTERSALFMSALDVDEMVAQLLASEGFSTGRAARLHRAQRNRLDPGLRRRDRGRAPEPRHRLSRRHRAASTTRSARSSASRTSSTRSPASTPRCSSRSARKASRPSRTLPAVPPTISSAGPSARTARPSASTAPSRISPSRARKPRT